MNNAHTPLPPDEDDEVWDEIEQAPQQPSRGVWARSGLSGAPRDDEMAASDADDNFILGFDTRETPQQRRARFEGLNALSSDDDLYFTKADRKAAEKKATTTDKASPTTKTTPPEPSVTPPAAGATPATPKDENTSSSRLMSILAGLVVLLGLVGIGLTIGMVKLATRPTPAPSVVKVTEHGSPQPPSTATVTATTTQDPATLPAQTVTSTTTASPVTSTVTSTTTAPGRTTTTTTTLPAASPTDLPTVTVTQTAIPQPSVAP